MKSEICALNGIEPINSSLIQVANQIQQATVDPPITSTYKLIQPRVENINTGMDATLLTIFIHDLDQDRMAHKTNSLKIVSHAKIFGHDLENDFDLVHTLILTHYFDKYF